MNSNKFSIRSRFGSFKFAFRGIARLLKNEHNSRIHLVAAAIAIALGLILAVSITEWMILVIVIGLVFSAELINSSIESLANSLNTERDENIMKAKDYAAAAVLITAIGALLAGCLIFIPKLIILF